MLAAVLALPAVGHEEVPSGTGASGHFRHEVTTQFPGTRAAVLDGRVPAIFLRVESPALELTVLGEGGEPLARVSSSGVEVNDASPTWALTARGRGGSGPDGPVEEDAPPRWRTEGNDGQLTWLEPRAAPPRKGRDYEWSVPARLDGRAVSLRGRGIWQAHGDKRRGFGPAGWALVAGGGAVLLAVVPLALNRRRGRHAEPPPP